MKFDTTCSISGVPFRFQDHLSVKEPELEDASSDFSSFHRAISLDRRNCHADIRFVHPIFSLKRNALLHFMPKTASAPELPLFFQAFWHTSGLIHWNAPGQLISPANPFCAEQKAIFFSRLISILKWIDDTGIPLPTFNFTAETGAVLNSSFLRDLEDLREEKRRQTKTSRAIASLPEGLDATVASRAARNLKVLTPQMAKRIASVINWTGPNEDIAVQLLTIEGTEIVKLMAKGEVFLGDVSNLLDDLEISGWVSSLRIKAIEHMREVVDTIKMLRGLSTEETETFTAMPHAANVTLSTLTKAAISSRFTPTVADHEAAAKIAAKVSDLKGLSLEEIFARRKITLPTSITPTGAE